MVKLLLCLVCAFVVGICTLQLRQQQLELRHQAARFQQEIEGQQARLWNQQLQITLATSTNTVVNTIEQQDLSLVPEARLPQAAGDWLAKGKKTQQ